jgi:hypothetical protein
MKKSDVACRDIRAARSESDVITAVRGYLDSLSAEEASVLPAELLARGISQAEELIQSALALVHDQMLGKHDSPDASLLNEIELVFSTAAKRLAVLARDTA